MKKLFLFLFFFFSFSLASHAGDPIWSVSVWDDISEWDIENRKPFYSIDYVSLIETPANSYTFQGTFYTDYDTGTFRLGTYANVHEDADIVYTGIVVDYQVKDTIDGGVVETTSFLNQEWSEFYLAGHTIGNVASFDSSYENNLPLNLVFGKVGRRTIL